MYFRGLGEVTSLSTREKAGGLPSGAVTCKGNFFHTPGGPDSPATCLCQDRSCFPETTTILWHNEWNHRLTQTRREQKPGTGPLGSKRRANCKSLGCLSPPRSHCKQTSTQCCLHQGSPALCQCQHHTMMGGARAARPVPCFSSTTQ